MEGAEYTLRRGALLRAALQPVVRDPVAKNFRAGQYFHALDFGGHKKSGFSERKGRGNFNGGLQRVLPQAVKARTAFRDVFTLDDFVALRWMANARAEIHTDTNVAAPVDGASMGVVFPHGHGSRKHGGSRRRQRLRTRVGGSRCALKLLEQGGSAGD